MKKLNLQGLRLGQKVSKCFRKWLKDKMGNCVNCAKSVMQIFVESAENAKSAKPIYATSATYASANFVGKESNESTVMYRVKSRIPSCLFRYSLDPILSRFCVVSLIYANKLLNHRTTPLGRFVLPEHLPFSKPKVNWLLHVSLICLCMLTVGVGNVWCAEGDVNYSLTFTKLSSGSNNESYTDDHSITVSSKGWTVRGNQTVGAYLCVGGKNTSATDRAMYSTSAIGSTVIGKVRVTTGGKGGTGTLTFSKIVLEVASNSTFTTIIDTKTINSPSQSGNIDFTPTAPLTSWPASSYYRIKYTYKNSRSDKNVYVIVNSVTFYEGTSALYEVTYDAGSGTCATDSWAQTSAGQSTTLPTATPCSGWTFAGWCTSSAGSSAANTTSPGTILTGSYTPTDDITLYAVYTKSEGGGSSNVTFNFGYADDWGQSGSWSGTSKDEVSATKSGVTITYTRNGSNLYANSTSIRFYQKNTLTFEAAKLITAISFTVSTYQTDITSDVGTCTATSSELSWSGNSNSVTFTRPTDASSYAQMSAATITISNATIYYMTSSSCAAACAAPTALTKGSFIGGTQKMPINWTSAAGKVDVCYSTSSTKPDATPSGSYTVVSNQTSSPVNLDASSLSAGTNYYVWARSVCSADSKSDWVAVTGNYFTLPTHTLTVSKSGGDAGCSVSPTSQTVVEGRTVSITATAGSGYDFSSWAVSGTGATLSSTSANPTTFTMGTANATVTGTFTASACSASPTVTAGSNSSVTHNSARVTCASGISSLGSVNCSISSYGFVIGTSANPSIGGSGVTQHEVGTSYASTGVSFYKDLTGLSASTTYYVRPYATNGNGTSYGTQTSFTTLATPTITVSETARAFNDRKVNGGPYEMTFTVSGANLTENIGLAISGTNAAMFSIDKTIITPSTGTVSSTEITVSYSPTGADSHSATINITSAGAADKTVTLTGTGKWEVTWNNNGETSTTLVANSTKPTFPSTPSSCDGTSTTFIGWATSRWDGKLASLAGKTVHTAASTMDAVTDNGTTYYAVFAKGGLYWGRLTSSELSGLSAGDKLVIVAVDQGYVLNNDLTCSSSVPSETDGKITPTDGIQWTLAGSAGSWQIKSGSDIMGTLYDNCAGSGNGLALNFNTYHQYYTIASSSHNTNEFYIKDNSCDYGVLTKVSKYDAFRVVTVGSSYSSEASAALKLYTQKGSYSDYMTTCCDKNVTLANGSPSNGTVTFSPAGPIATCTATASERTTTMTITPNTGYYLSNYTSSGVSTSNSPSIATSGNTSEAAQEISLEFAQNTTSGTYTANATFSQIMVSSLSLRVQQTGQSDKTGDDLTMTCYPKEGQTGAGNDPLEHSLKVLFEEVLPATALAKTYTWSVRVKASGDADWTDVSFDGNTLNTNSVIYYFNKSVGTLQMKNNEGTAEIKITANDGSGVSAKVTITVANVAMTGVSVDPTLMSVYAGQKKQVAVTFTPANATDRNYSAGSSYTYVTIQNKAAASFNIEGKTSVTDAEHEEKVTVTTDDGSYTATVDVTVIPLPKATFIDLVHDLTDFTVGGADLPASGIMSAAISADKMTVTTTLPVPTHADVEQAGETCEKTRKHLVGWIDGAWSGWNYLDNADGTPPNKAAIEAAGSGVWIPVGSNIDLVAQDGHTYYAVWATVE